MSEDVHYKPDYRDTGRMMRSPEMHGTVDLVALEAIAFAKAISPDATPYGVGYVDSWEVHGGTTKVGRARRASADLLNTARYAAAVEYGQLGDHSRADTGHHVLARTADHIERG